MVRVSADLTFDQGSATLKASAAETIKKLAQVLSSPEANSFCIFVAGHTDDVPLAKPEDRDRYEDSLGLSLARARVVAKALCEEKIDPARVSVMGFGKYRPSVPNAPGNKGNILNRRVELWIASNDLFASSPTTKPASEPMSEKRVGPNLKN
jgi:chemotaxis protein MotB